MTREALEVILKLWSDEDEFDYRGTYWHVTKGAEMYGFLRPHLKPLQQPHPPIGVAGLSSGSDTLKLAGEHGFIPMSLNLNPAYVASHWEAVEEGAHRTGRTPDRSSWRMVREVFVAETDAEAQRLSVGGMMGRMMGEYFLPLLAQFGFTDYLKHAPDVADSDVTPEYCAEKNWLIGSPSTVIEKLQAVYEEVGGFGTLLVFGFDYQENPEAWHTSMGLLMSEVLPKVRDLRPGGPLSKPQPQVSVARRIDQRANANGAKNRPTGERQRRVGDGQRCDTAYLGPGDQRRHDQVGRHMSTYHSRVRSWRSGAVHAEEVQWPVTSQS
jgi:alkanesulfonate monooxygenase SsuD/methylene tetrahydromethanopterin reductase-like flavin-dependent oxidoreductase (luciferase family)